MSTRKKAGTVLSLGGLLAALQVAQNVLGIASIPADAVTWWGWTPVIGKYVLSYGFGILGLIGMAWGGYLLLKERSRTAPARPSEPTATGAGSPARARITVVWPPPKGTQRFPKGGFVWIDDHPFDLIDRVKGRTQVETNATSQLYKFKWSPLEAIVRDVRQGDDLNKMIHVTLDGDEAHQIFLTFWSMYGEHLLHLVPGKKLRFVGMIDRFDGRELHYKECEPLPVH